MPPTHMLAHHRGRCFSGFLPVDPSYEVGTVASLALNTGAVVSFSISIISISGGDRNEET